MFRSAVFICDNPGSIAASIAHTKSGSDIQAMLLKKLSSGGSVDTKDEQGKDTNATPKQDKRVKSASRASKGGSLSGQRRYSISATSIRSLQYSQGSLVASKSANSTLSTKRSGEHTFSKQITSNLDEVIQVAQFIRVVCIEINHLHVCTTGSSNKATKWRSCDSFWSTTWCTKAGFHS